MKIDSVLSWDPVYPALSIMSNGKGHDNTRPRTSSAEARQRNQIAECQSEQFIGIGPWYQQKGNGLLRGLLRGFQYGNDVQSHSMSNSRNEDLHDLQGLSKQIQIGIVRPRTVYSLDSASLILS